MPVERINQVQLYYEALGSGEPLVLVHGSWADHGNWAAVAPLLSETFRVVTFDRRGHSQSQTPPGQGSVRDDADDLGGLIDQLGLAPAHVVGNSFGASIALRLAGQRPQVFRSLVAHEPPLIDLLRGQPEFQPVLDGFEQRILAVLQLLRAGQMEDGARQFVETVALGAGGWDMLPEPVRATFVRNAPTFLDETNDPEGLTLDLDALGRFDGPALITLGTTSPPFFKPIAELVAQALPRSKTEVFEGAGHVPHLSHPYEYVQTVGRFCSQPG